MKINEITNMAPASQTVKRVSGTQIELSDPKKPAVKTVVDLKKANVTKDDKGETVIEPKAKPGQTNTTIRPNTKVKLRGFDNANK